MRGYLDLFRGVPTSSDAISEYTYTRPLTYNSETGNRNTYKLRRPYTRQLHNTANVISIPQQFYGEYIEPHSFRLTDDATDGTFILQDDGRGNIYDVAFSSSYASKSPNAKNSGSVVGNIFYNLGVFTITETASFDGTNNYSDVTSGNYSVKYQGVHEIRTYEWTCEALPNELNQTQNETIFKPNTGGKLKNNLTGSEGFPTFVTEVGLYDDDEDLVGIAKISKAIPKSKKIPMRFYVRMDY